VGIKAVGAGIVGGGNIGRRAVGTGKVGAKSVGTGRVGIGIVGGGNIGKSADGGGRTTVGIGRGIGRGGNIGAKAGGKAAPAPIIARGVSNADKGGAMIVGGGMSTCGGKEERKLRFAMGILFASQVISVGGRNAKSRGRASGAGNPRSFRSEGTGHRLMPARGSKYAIPAAVLYNNQG
jgi:hypothetical protein